ncbi:hypothetical protein VTO42DRAFT_1095 [Malbranchea cinnamomea]
MRTNLSQHCAPNTRSVIRATSSGSFNIRITRDRPESEGIWPERRHQHQDSPVKGFHSIQSYEGVANNEGVHYYQRRIGSLLFPAFMTRSDIAHARSARQIYEGLSFTLVKLAD